MEQSSWVRIPVSSRFFGFRCHYEWWVFWLWHRARFRRLDFFVKWSWSITDPQKPQSAQLNSFNVAYSSNVHSPLASKMNVYTPDKTCPRGCHRPVTSLMTRQVWKPEHFRTLSESRLHCLRSPGPHVPSGRMTGSSATLLIFREALAA